MRGSVCGYVVVGPTGEPIEGAAIVASGSGTPLRITEPVQSRGRPPAPPYLAAALTDSFGRFTFDLREGHWLFRAQGPGGETLGEASVPVFANALSEVTIEVAELPHAARPDSAPRPVDTPPPTVLGSVRGRVVRADNGKPVGVAAITVVRAPGPAPDPAPLTDEAGWFVLNDLPAGDWLLRALGPGGETGEASVQVLDNALSDLTIEVGDLPRGTRRGRQTNKVGRGMPGSVRGRVVRADDGKPVTDAAITVVRGAGPAPDISPLTNAEGWFALDGLPAGDWLFRAIGPGGEMGEGSVRVSGESVGELTIKIA